MQKFIVGLVGVFTLKDLPEDYEKFVEYKATIDKKELDDTVPIAILQLRIQQVIMFYVLDSYNSMEEIDKEIEESLDGEIYNFNVRNILEGHLNGH